MNKINKKPKNKLLKKKKISKEIMKTKTNKKSIKKLAKNAAKKDIEINGKQQTDEEFDNDLKQELNEIITDFRKSSKKSDKKSAKNKSKDKKSTKDMTKTNNSFDTKTDKTNANEMNFMTKTSDNKSKRNKKLLIQTNTKWYEMRVFAESVDSSAPKHNRLKADELRREAQELLAKDIQVYNERQEMNTSAKGKDFEWIRTVLRSGTLADRLSAHTILIQDSAVHNLKSLEQIISMVSTKGKRECIMALDNLRELFVGDLLIPGAKLKTFFELIQCFDDQNRDKKSRKRQLVLCLFEELLKNTYRLFLDSVAKVSHDSVETTKHKSLITFFDLLVNNGEQEQYLLSNLVNKLGDPLAKLAAQASHLLNQLINQYHPLMKTVVVEEVERLLYRPNIGQRAQYYSLCFLSEVIFNVDDDRPLANRLIKIYFGYFKACIKKGDINNKMMSVLLTGVSRAFPYSKLETNILEEHLQTFYKIIHFVSLNTSIQALLLIFNIIDVNQSGLLTDRFYTVLYRHIQDSQIENCSRKAMFLNLIYRAMKRDPIVRRVRAFAKRLLQIALNQSSSLATSILILISEVIKSKPGLILTKEVKEVVNQCDVGDNEEEDEERYEDLPISDDEVEANAVETTAESGDPSSDAISGSVSWVHNKNLDTNRTKSRHYDPNARNPLFAAAEAVDLWELDLMKHHFHPSTTLFTEKILNKEPIEYSGDPLNDFSLKHFLDRFVFRNPKKIDKKSSKGSKVFGRLPAPTDSDQTSVALNSKAYVNQPESRIPIDEKFIYNYLKQKIATKADGYDSDVESVTSVEFESLLDRLEPMSRKERNLDFAKDLYKETNYKNKKQKTSDESDGNDSADEFDDQFGDNDGDNDEEEDPLDFDDDPEFADAFDGVDSELEEALDGKSDNSSGIGPKKRKQGFDSMTNDLFASADEFAQLLEANESDSDLSADGADATDLQTEIKNKRKLSRKKKKKFNKKDLDF